MDLNKFNVVAHFNLEIASALLNTKMITGSINELSEAAEAAQNSILGIGKMLVGNYLMPTSILGIAGAAIKAADSFQSAQTEWANLISMNRHNLTGTIETFNDRLTVSRSIMKEIAEQAARFGLPEKELNYTATKMAADLSNKGLAGTNFDFPIEMARNLLKSAPALSVDPGLVYGSMQRAFMGGASRNDPLFSRLAMDTKTMKPFSGADGTKLFNALPMVKRIKTLNEAMGEFTKDTQVLDRRLNSITGQVNLLTSSLTGFNGIITNLGEKLYPFVIEALNKVNDIVKDEIGIVATNISKTIDIFGKDLESLSLNLFTAAEAGAAFNHAKIIVGIIEITTGLMFVSKMLGFGALGFLKPILKFLPSLATIGRAFSFLASNFAVIAPVIFKGAMMIFKPLMMIVGLFTILSRAYAMARIMDLQALPELMVRISGAVARISEAFKKFMAPIMAVVDAIAYLIAPLFRSTIYYEFAAIALEKLATAMESAADYMVMLTAAFDGFLAWAAYGVQNLMDLNWDAFKGDKWSQFVESAFEKTTLDYANRSYVTSNQTVNIGQVKIENKFKDNAQPDRIAFTMRDQLLDLAESRRQANTLPFTPAFGR